MKTLIYGFKPYKKYKKNISEEIVKKINKTKAIFKVKFNKSQYINKIKQTKPDIIIGIAQHPRAKKIRIERKAVNIYRKNKKAKPKLIKKSPKSYLVNLKLKPTKDTIVTYNAGTYGCNYSMYIILDYIKNKNIKFAFIHIPKDYNLKKAVKIVNKLINL
jgi:pyrrolidone-carboxylate peptidase